MNKFKKSTLFLPTIGILITLLFALSACGSAPNVDWDLSVSGDVNNPTIFTYKDLVKLPQDELNDILMEKSRGEDEFRSFSGVKLSTLFEKVDGPANPTTIIATAADGYQIEISADEMVDGMIALKDGGDWITKTDPTSGPIRLVFPATPANRWVFQVIEIEVIQ